MTDERPHDAFLVDTAQRKAVEAGVDIALHSDDPLFNEADATTKHLLLGRAIREAVPALEGGPVVGFMAAGKAMRIAAEIRELGQ